MAEKKSDKKPRVRKIETVREKQAKASAKAEAKAAKSADQRTKRRVRSAAGTVAKPFRAPVRVLTWPFRTRPVRFVGKILGRILWPKYFRNSWNEIRQVTWPDRKTTWKLTLSVLIFAVLFGLAAAGTDWVLDKIVKRIIFRG